MTKIVNTSIKLKNSIHSRLEKIKNVSFTEDDIKLLLIDIRETIKEESLLREFADFIAHPTRNQGIFNKALNSRYLKLKLIDDQKDKLTIELQKDIKTERQLTDFLLSGIDITKVGRRLFEVLFKDGLNDISEKVFKKHYPLSKKQVLKLITDSYQLDTKNQFYELKNLKSFNVVEDALKFIRGTIQANAVFSQQTFEKEITTATSRVINLMGFDSSYSVAIKKNLKEILLCILCLLHDAKFVFHDGHIGSCFLSIYPNGNLSPSSSPEKNSLISLISDDIGMLMPIFISNIKITDHLDLEQNDFANLKHMEKMPWITTSRNEQNKLILTL